MSDEISKKRSEKMLDEMLKKNSMNNVLHFYYSVSKFKVVETLREVLMCRICQLKQLRMKRGGFFPHSALSLVSGFLGVDKYAERIDNSKTHQETRFPHYLDPCPCHCEHMICTLCNFHDEPRVAQNDVIKRMNENRDAAEKAALKARIAAAEAARVKGEKRRKTKRFGRKKRTRYGKNKEAIRRSMLMTMKAQSV